MCVCVCLSKALFANAKDLCRDRRVIGLCLNELQKHGERQLRGVKATGALPRNPAQATCPSLGGRRAAL